MTHDGMKHPQSLVALSIVRTRGEFSNASRICSVALFEVGRTRGGPSFALEHLTFGPPVTRADIISDISNRLPRSAAVLSAAPEIPRGHFRRLLVQGDSLPPADIQLVQRARPDLKIMPLQIGQRALAATAESLGIPLADRGGSTLERGRRAPDHAQALWAAFVLSLCSRRDRVDLITAYQAWSVLQRARPVRF